jgi:hypothetical protein
VAGLTGGVHLPGKPKPDGDHALSRYVGVGLQPMIRGLWMTLGEASRSLVNAAVARVAAQAPDLEHAGGAGRPAERR